MHRIIIASLFASSFSLAANLPEDKTFVRHLFETTKKCEEYKKQHGTWFNCSQSVSLHKDGTARVIVTDIVNPAKYTVEGNKVTVTPTGPSEIGKAIVFTLTENKRNLVDEALQVWEWRAQ